MTAGRSIVVVSLYLLGLAAMFVAARVANPPAARQPFTGVQIISTSGLELDLRELSLQQSVALKDGRARRTLTLGANVREPDGGYGFTTERILRIEELRDESGSDLLSGTVTPTSDSRDPLYDFRGEGHVPTPTRGHACWASARVEGLARTPSRFSVIRGRVMAYKIADLRTFLVSIPVEPEKQNILSELTPGYWFSLDDLTMSERGASWAFRDWQCNNVAPEFAGRPEVGRRRNLNTQFILGDSPPSVPGYTGHDASRPPFLRQIRFVTARGQVIHRTAQGALAIRRPSGIYSEDGGRFSAGRKLEAADLPLRVEVDVVVAVEPVALEFDLRNVPLGAAAVAAVTQPDARTSDSTRFRPISDRGPQLTITPVEPPSPAGSARQAPAPAAQRTVLFDIDFEAPLHNAGSPPALSQPRGTGREKSNSEGPRRVPSANGNQNLPAPTVVDDSAVLLGQVLRLAPAADKTAQWIMLDVERIGGARQRFAGYLVEFDLVVERAGGPAPSFILFADVPPVQPIKWNSDFSFAVPAAPDSKMGRWKLGEVQRVHSVWDERSRMVALTISGEKIGRFPYGGDGIKAFRFSASNSPRDNGEPAIALVDNVRVTGLNESAEELKTQP